MVDHEPEPKRGADAGVRNVLRQLEGVLLRSQETVVSEVGARVLPAWNRVTGVEPRWQASLGVIGAVVLQYTLPDEVAFRPRWVLPVLAGLLLVALRAANPRGAVPRTPALRAGSMTLIAIISTANAFSAGHLVTDLLQGESTGDATRLLLTGGAIWVTNVIAFGLWYWELDRGGPINRAHAVREYPDFLFVQMQNPELAPPDWEPAFVDYLYLSFTNAAAFSPTDVLPLSRWAKATMLLQSAVSLTTVALVVARAVNTLR